MAGAGRRFIEGAVAGGGAVAETGNPYVIAGGAVLGSFGNMIFGGESAEERRLRERSNELQFELGRLEAAGGREALKLGKLQRKALERQNLNQMRNDRAKRNFAKVFKRSLARNT